MENKKINLEEILWGSFYNNGIPKPTHTLAEITQKAVKEAMLEFGKQLLQLAGENAKIKRQQIVYENAGCDYKIIVNKQSILNTIKQVE